VRRPATPPRGSFGIRLAVALSAAVLLGLPIAVLAAGGVFSLTAHGSTTTGAFREPSIPRGECDQCHTLHSVSGTGNPYALFQAYTTAADKNAVCASCHALPAGSWPGLAAYSASAHGSITGSGNVYPGTGYDATSCMNCHDPHGVRDASSATLAPFSRLLRVWAGAGTAPNTTSARSNEEQLCYGGGAGCHAFSNAKPDSYGSPGPIGGILERFTSGTATATSPASGHRANTRHDIGFQDQTAYNAGARIECVNCHNPHTDATTFQENVRSWLAQPSNRQAPFTVRYRPTNAYQARGYAAGADLDPTFGQTMPDFVAFCLDCHDNTSVADWPSGVAPGSTPGTNHPLNIGLAYLGIGGVAQDKHGALPYEGTYGALRYPYFGTPGQSGRPSFAYAAMPCTDCHDPHGSRNLYHLKETIRIDGVTLGSDIVLTGDQWYRFCLTCHVLNAAHPAVTETSACGGCHVHGAGL
jgi:hypothetical protein